ncbi:Domain of unknown function DUF2017 [Segniliparus rotundus DSM 44985]|uniref:Uncharacterized protein n=1 Tax=Segniliparus rotundus (strain ATCC BAA-972 / CDC 1076 / CIP 108378 / DSM 44985 / JCM 13578) TaxID=640132 RepID=D6Z7P9_SEGRD|nr:DUF2017 domain-containing protein [Segniliparus rotundus]ADG97979.1 Domain of unknown function DUF2017 [Segniliparus rotundus DSM 44985]
MPKGEIRVGPWRRGGSGAEQSIRVRFAEHELQVLRTLSRSVLDWFAERRNSEPSDELAELTGIRTGHTEPPSSAALRRLLPDMCHPDDEGTDSAEVRELNAAMRGLHEPEVLEAKEGAGRVFLDSLPEHAGEVVLTLDEAKSWVAALNDLRLTLGSILGVAPDTPERLPPGHPHAAQLGVYHWLTVLQESLLIALTR